MTPASKDLQFSGLIRCLIEKGLLTEGDAQIYMQEAQKKQVSLIPYLVTNKLIDSKVLASQASQEFGVPFFDLDAIDFRRLPVNLVSEKLIRKCHALPLFTRGKTLFVAVSDPTNFHALDDIKFHSRLNPEAIMVEEDKLTKAIEASLEAADTSMTDMLDEDLDNLDITGGEVDNTKAEVTSDIDDAPIVRYVNKILLDSIKQGVSDIHMEPYEKVFRIRYRSDGILHQPASPADSSPVSRLCLRWILLSAGFHRMVASK
jgi:type IV pilus assembly protein PilB